MNKLAVIAIGGNALIKDAEHMTVLDQYRRAGETAEHIAEVLARGWRAVITHGNGPQVGLMALQAAAYDHAEPYPLDVLGAQTEGMIGYMIEQEMGNLLPMEVPFASLLTMIEVDPEDPAFADPTKFIGPVYEEAEARRLAAEGARGRL